jgi:hypothetical protein
LQPAVTDEHARLGERDRPFADTVAVLVADQVGDPLVRAGVVADTAEDKPRCFNVGVDIACIASTSSSCSGRIVRRGV